jgi:serine/threonine protein kinase
VRSETSTPRSDLYALGVITYQMLTGHLPYGTRMAQARTRTQQQRVAYQPMAAHNPDIAPWIDAAVRRAVDPDPAKRQHDVIEFAHALTRPPDGGVIRADHPLIERDPVLLWQLIAGALFAIVIIQALWR